MTILITLNPLDNRKNSTHLQGYSGYALGTPAGDLKAGDTLVWNYGETSKVTAIVKKTKCYITIQEDGVDFLGKPYNPRRFKKSQIIVRPTSELPKS